MRPEHIPIDAYRLLRQIAVNKKLQVPPSNPDNDAAREFLLRHGLAAMVDNGTHLVATNEGLAVGRLLKIAP